MITKKDIEQLKKVFATREEMYSISQQQDSKMDSGFQLVFERFDVIEKLLDHITQNTPTNSTESADCNSKVCKVT